MKRDLDLIRKILFYLESKETDQEDRELIIDGYTGLQIMYHLVLLDNAGMLFCEREVSSSNPERVLIVYPYSLTWKGHNFLDSCRNEDIWNKAKKTILDKTGSLSFELIKELLVKLAMESIGV